MAEDKPDAPKDENAKPAEGKPEDAKAAPASEPPKAAKAAPPPPVDQEPDEQTRVEPSVLRKSLAMKSEPSSSEKNDAETHADADDKAVEAEAAEKTEREADTGETAVPKVAREPEEEDAEPTKADRKRPKTDPPHTPEKPAAWALPVVRFDAWLTKVETRLVFGVLMAEIGALVVWVMLKGFAMPAGDGRGRFIRAAFLGGLFAGVGALAMYLQARREKKDRTEAREAGESPSAPANNLKHLPAALGVVGVLVGVFFRGLGAEYTQNWLNWLQNASILFLIGGLRGLVTRLTLWVALLGASLATGKGKHINIDIVLRQLAPKLRVPVTLVGIAATVVMCVTGAWGFVDQLAIGEYHAPRTAPCPEDKSKTCEVPPGEKIAKIREEAGRDLFLLGRQLALDVRTLPVVVRGQPYDKWMSAREWNTFVDEGGWEKHYDIENVKRLRVADDRAEPMLPAVNVPGGEENSMALLVRDLSLVIPFGLLIIAIRFVMRALLILSGHVTVDPDAAHADDDDEPDPGPHPGPGAPNGAGAAKEPS